MGNFDGLRGLTVTYNALKHPKTVASGTTMPVYRMKLSEEETQITLRQKIYDIGP